MNRTSDWAVFEFISSNPKLMDVNIFHYTHNHYQIAESKKGLNKGDKCNIELKIPSRTKTGIEEVILFASDQ